MYHPSSPPSYKGDVYYDGYNGEMYHQVPQHGIEERRPQHQHNLNARAADFMPRENRLDMYGQSAIHPGFMPVGPSNQPFYPPVEMQPHHYPPQRFDQVQPIYPPQPPAMRHEPVYPSFVPRDVQPKGAPRSRPARETHRERRAAAYKADNRPASMAAMRTQIEKLTKAVDMLTAQSRLTGKEEWKGKSEKNTRGEDWKSKGRPEKNTRGEDWKGKKPEKGKKPTRGEDWKGKKPESRDTKSVDRGESSKERTPKKKRLGKAARVSASVFSSVLEVIKDDKVVGSAFVLGDRVYKAKHVVGEIQGYKFSPLVFDVSAAPYSGAIENSAAAFLPGILYWKHGKLTLTGETLTGAFGGPGDSGNPVTNKDGKIVAMITGGVSTGDTRKYSYITMPFGEQKLQEHVEKGATQWSGVSTLPLSLPLLLFLLPFVLSTCSLYDKVFDCSRPPIYPCLPVKGKFLSYAKQDTTAAWELLSANMWRKGYPFLYEAVTTCATNRRVKRSPKWYERTVEWYDRPVEEPFTASCSVCTQHGQDVDDLVFTHPCSSPIAITDIFQEGETIRVTSSAYFFHAAKPNSSYIRYLGEDNRIYDGFIMGVRGETTSECTYLRGDVHILTFRCPDGLDFSLRVDFLKSAKQLGTVELESAVFLEQTHQYEHLFSSRKEGYSCRVPMSGEGTNKVRIFGKQNQLTMPYPYAAFCEECGTGPCTSPVSIEEISAGSDDGVIRIQISAQFDVDEEGAAKPGFLRFALAGNITTAPYTRIGVATGPACTVLSVAGHFLLAKCEAGGTVSVKVDVPSVSTALFCKKKFAFEGVRKDSMEHNPIRSTLHGSRPCLKYYTQPVGPAHQTVFFDVHEPGPGDHHAVTFTATKFSWFFKGQDRAVVRVVCGTRPITVKISGKGTRACAVNGTISIRDFPLRGQFPSINRPFPNKWHRHFKVPIPFELHQALCPVSKAPLPKISFSAGTVHLSGTATYPTRLIVRSLGPVPNLTDRWISGPYVLAVTVPRPGVSLNWGNNDVLRYWPIVKMLGDPYGNLSQIISFHYYNNFKPAVSAFVASIVMVLGVILFCVCVGKKCRHLKATAKFYKPVVLLLTLCSGYEHNIILSLDPLASPYTGIVHREGYEPFNLTVSVNRTEVIPTVSLEYWTCVGKVQVMPPVVSCCTDTAAASICPSDAASGFHGIPIADPQCRLDAGVYMYMWGGAYCFCATSNTQVSIAGITLDESCKIDRAYAYRVHVGRFSADLHIQLGNQAINVTTFVDGFSTYVAKDLTIVAGPISSVFSPFDPKVVVYRGGVYNYDWPPYSAGLPGTFGDIQSRSTNFTNPHDLYGNMGLVLHSPAGTKYVHVDYTAQGSGLVRWYSEHPLPLNVSAPFGCDIHVDPLRAVNCGAGLVPVSIDIPESGFTRVVHVPIPSGMSCRVTTCVQAVDFGGAASVVLHADRSGSCAVHSTSEEVVIQTHAAAIIAGQNYVELTFSTNSLTPDFRVEVCGETVECSGTCVPPKEHITTDRQHGYATGSGGSPASVQHIAYIVGGTVVATVLACTVLGCTLSCYRRAIIGK